MFVMSLFILFLSLYYGDREPATAIIAAPAFVLGILLFMFLFSSVYLFIRGVFRSKDYVRPFIDQDYEDEYEIYDEAVEELVE